MAQMRLHITLTRQHTLKQRNLLGSKCGGHAWIMVLRFYFFSLPITVAVFSFNFFDVGRVQRNASKKKPIKAASRSA
jgi:hypothetical protein